MKRLDQAKNPRPGALGSSPGLTRPRVSGGVSRFDQGPSELLKSWREAHHDPGRRLRPERIRGARARNQDPTRPGTLEEIGAARRAEVAAVDQGREVEADTPVPLGERWRRRWRSTADPSSS